MVMAMVGIRRQLKPEGSRAFLLADAYHYSWFAVPCRCSSAGHHPP